MYDWSEFSIALLLLLLLLIITIITIIIILLLLVVLYYRHYYCLIELPQRGAFMTSDSPGPICLEIQRPFSWTPAWCVSSTMISHAERVASWNDESQLVACFLGLFKVMLYYVVFTVAYRIYRERVFFFLGGSLSKSKFLESWRAKKIVDLR